jgi:hypothetical protein
MELHRAGIDFAAGARIGGEAALVCAGRGATGKVSGEATADDRAAGLWDERLGGATMEANRREQKDRVEVVEVAIRVPIDNRRGTCCCAGALKIES